MLGVAAAAYAVIQVAIGVVVGSPRAIGAGFLLGAFAAWVTAFPRRDLGHKRIESVITRAAVGLTAVVFAVALLEPFVGLVAATALLIPIAAALPYLEVWSLRRLIFVAWAGIIAAGAASFLPDDGTVPLLAEDLVEFSGLILASGIVLFLLYQSSQSLKASSREFRRLFTLSSDLADTTDPGVVGGLVARHLAEATSFDECVIYSLAPDTGRLVPFGSHPAERSLTTEPQSVAERPMLGRVIHDRARIVVDLSDERADRSERARLRTLGRQVLLLLPLVARSAPVGVAELTGAERRPIDERRLALARTLAFEAAMAIENGRLYQELRERSLHDQLTGLANRSLFADRLDHALARLARQKGTVAVLFVDLDDFKAVNDTLGHAWGDRLLKLVAERLGEVVRPTDTVARLGGDEFALVLEELSSVDDALLVAGRAIDALAVPFELAGQTVRVSASVGAAVRDVAGAAADELIQEADVAMYEAKRAGKGRAVRFANGLHKPSRAAKMRDAAETVGHTEGPAGEGGAGPPIG